MMQLLMLPTHMLNLWFRACDMKHSWIPSIVVIISPESECIARATAMAIISRVNANISLVIAYFLSRISYLGIG